MSHYLKLPARCILEGLRAAGLKQIDIAQWYGVTKQAVSYKINHGREWSRAGNGKQPNGNGHVRGALPPSSVLTTWQRWGWSPEKIAEACKRFEKERKGQ